MKETNGNMDEFISSEPSMVEARICQGAALKPDRRVVRGSLYD